MMLLVQYDAIGAIYDAIDGNTMLLSVQHVTNWQHFVFHMLLSGIFRGVISYHTRTQCSTPLENECNMMQYDAIVCLL